MPGPNYLGLGILPFGCLSSATGLLLMKSSADLFPELPPCAAPCCARLLCTPSCTPCCAWRLPGSSTREAGIPLSRRAPTPVRGRWRSWRWLLGFVLLGVVATSIEVVVLGMLPLSLVAPFSGLTICFSLAVASTGVIAPAEALSRHDYLGVLLILLGVTGVSAFGPHGSGGTLAELVADFEQARCPASARASRARF